MNPAFFLADRRAPALLAVLLIHLLAGGLLLREQRRLPLMPQASTVLRLIAPPRSAPLPPPAAPRPAQRALALPTQLAAPQAITLPTLPEEAGAALEARAPSQASSAPAALDLRLPIRSAAPARPSIADQIRADPRGNSLRETAVERMANAFGARGWTVVELSDGGRKVTGPFGECQIIRPSMVDGLHEHPHAGLLPARVFSCGGIEKGSLKHERPK